MNKFQTETVSILSNVSMSSSKMIKNAKIFSFIIISWQNTQYTKTEYIIFSAGNNLNNPIRISVITN